MTSFNGPVYVDGIAVTGQGIPATFGKVVYVDPDNGNDENDGLSPDKAKLTIDGTSGGYAALDSNKNDVLVLAANSSYTLADEWVITKNRIHVIGLDLANRYYGQGTKINLGVTTGSAIAAVNNQGVRNTFHNLKITNSDTLSTSLYGVCEAGEFSQWTNCEILKTTDLDQTGAAEVLHCGDSPLWRNCSFGNMIYQPSVARQNVLFTRGLSPTSNVSRDVHFENCLFSSFATSATFVNLRATTNDIERFANFVNCIFASKPGSTTQALVWGIASALTDAYALMHNCAALNITDIAAGSSGVYTTSPTPSATGTEAVQVTTS